MTFSLLPDFLSSRLTGDLDEVERVVVRVEGSRSVEHACAGLREEVELPGVLRWVRRRLCGVRDALRALVTAMPDKLGVVPEVTAIREVLGTDQVLMALRGIGGVYLHALPRPLGLNPPPPRRTDRDRRFQHEAGPDPPAGDA